MSWDRVFLIAMFFFGGLFFGGWLFTFTSNRSRMLKIRRESGDVDFTIEAQGETVAEVEGMIDRERQKLLSPHFLFCEHADIQQLNERLSRIEASMKK